MVAESVSAATAAVMQLSRADIQALLSRGPACNKLSPFANERANPTAPPQNAVQISRHPLFGKMIGILTQPELQITHRVADPKKGLTTFSAYANSQIDPGLMVIVYPGANDSAYVRVCATPDEYLVWCLSIVAAKRDERIANAIEQPMPFEALIYFLHTIDSVRRAYLKASLNYELAQDQFVSVSEFSSTMVQSLASTNLYWLLSSLIHTLPHLAEGDINPTNEHYETVAGMRVISAANVEGEPVFLFGELAQSLALEFMEGCASMMGTTSSILSSSNEVSVLSQYFVAPTSKTNHLFEITPGWMSQHYSASFPDLLECFRGIISAGLSAANVAASKRLAHERAAAERAAAEQVANERAAAEHSALARADAESGMRGAAGSGAAKIKHSWRSVKTNYLYELAQKLLAGPPPHTNEMGAIAELFLVRDKAGAYWRLSLNSLDWFTVVSGEWEKEAAPTEFWIEEPQFVELLNRVGESQNAVVPQRPNIQTAIPLDVGAATSPTGSTVVRKTVNLQRASRTLSVPQGVAPNSCSARQELYVTSKNPPPSPGAAPVQISAPPPIPRSNAPLASSGLKSPVTSDVRPGSPAAQSTPSSPSASLPPPLPSRATKKATKASRKLAKPQISNGDAAPPPMPLRCKQCRNVNTPSDKFCRQCGNNLRK